MTTEEDKKQHELIESNKKTNQLVEDNYRTNCFIKPQTILNQSNIIVLEFLYFYCNFISNFYF